MKKIIPYAMYLSLILFSGYGCEQVDSLSDAAEVNRFTIDNAQPASIRLSEPVLNSANGAGVITIPVLYGKYEFPLHLNVSVTTSEEATKILRMDFTKEIVFNTIDDAFRFYVVAASGRVKQWNIVLQELALDEQTQIERFDILSCLPDTARVGANALIKHVSSEVSILAIPDHLPTSIQPAITLAEKSAFEGYTPEQPLTFATPTSDIALTVKAESGKTQTWTVRRVECTDIHSVPDASPLVKSRLNLPVEALSFTLSEGMTLKNVSSNFDAGVIEIIAQGNAAAFPVTVGSGALPIVENTQTAGYVSGGSFTFTRFGEEKVFYIIDNASQQYIKWTIRLTEWKNSAAEITGFVITHSEPPAIVLKNPVDILPQQSAVHITITAGLSHFPLTIKPNVTISEQAHFKEPLPESFVFNSLSDEKTITVVSESGTEKVWTLKIINGVVLNTASDVVAFSLVDYSSESNSYTGSKVELASSATIDPIAKTISLTILNWKKYFPLKIKAAMELSPGATTPGFSPADEITFTTHTEKKTFVVQAENLVSSSSWTIQLIDAEPPKSSAAAVTDFTVGSNISSGSTVSVLYVEQGKKRVTILLSGAAFPLSINPQITLSTGAHLLDVTAGAELAFATVETEKTFRVMAEDETTINTWTIKLINAPQLTNWTLDAWQSSTSATGWSTPNPTGVTVVTRQSPGFGGSSYAAKLTSQTATIIIVKVSASGSLFLGNFDYKMANASRPKLMTWFGIPWQGRPIALEADYQYQRGSPRKDKNHNNVAGDDYGSATIELLHWDGTGTFEYHSLNSSDGYGTYPEPGITVTAHGHNYAIDNTSGWQKLRINLNTLDASKVPNYLHVTFASSYEGEKQYCAHGSTLTLDNIRLIYYEPETGAIVSQ